MARGHSGVKRVRINVAMAEAYLDSLPEEEAWKKERFKEIMQRTDMRPYRLPWRTDYKETEISTHPHYFNQETLQLPTACVVIDPKTTAAFVAENPEPPSKGDLLEAMTVVLAHLKDKTAGDRRLGESMAVLQRAVDEGT